MKPIGERDAMRLCGGCLCGAVRYETEAEPVFAGLCHCRDCLKATGAGGAPYMGFRLEDVRRSGETRRFTNFTDAGNPTSRLFCPICSTIVFGDGGEADASGLITLYAGTLDDPELFQPREIIFARSRPHWAVAMSHLPTYDTVPKT